MDQSELLCTFVVRGATVLLIVLLARLLAGLALAALARVVVDPRRAHVLAQWAVRVGPRCARGGIVVVTGVGIVVATSGAASAVGAPHVPVLDRAVVTTTASPPSPATPASTHRLKRAAPVTHVVRPGESLWSIAAASLGPTASTRAIARAWPRWYAANRDRVGPEPGTLHVGQRLRVPVDGAVR